VRLETALKGHLPQAHTRLDARIGPKIGPKRSPRAADFDRVKTTKTLYSKDAGVELAGLEPATSWVRSKPLST
jgi:hypothetical protein